MAVRTPDLAFGNLVRQGFPRDPGLNECAYVRLLVTQVVEVQDARVRLTAVDTWMTAEVLAHQILEYSRRVPAPLSRFRYLPLAVARVPLVGVLALAEKADPLPRLALQRSIWELDKRLGLTADPTGP